MGGIAGIVHFRGDPPDRVAAQQLSAGVAHRGPDDKALWAEGPAVMAQRWRRRDPGPPRRKLVHDDEWVLLVDGYDGEPKELLRRWREGRASAIQALPTGFAFAAWSRAEKTAWLVRDAVGTRPLFWTRDHDRLAFCSEMPPLLGLPWVGRDIALENLSEYLHFRYVHAPRTLFRDLFEVPSGHLLVCSARGAEIERWWRPPWAARGAPLPEPMAAARRIDDAVRGAVERLRAEDGPVGLLHSGGLDSNALLYHANQSGPPVPTFTVSLDGDPSDEAAFAGRTAKLLGSSNETVRITSRELIDAVDTAALEMGQPPATSAAVLLHLFYRQLRGHVRVLWSGDGGDEVLGGRSLGKIVSRMRVAALLHRLPGPTRVASRELARLLRLPNIAATYARFGEEQLVGGSRVFRLEERVRLLRDPAMVRPDLRQSVLEPLYREVESDPVNAILHVWQRGWLAQDRMTRNDRMGRHLGLDVRYPLLDREVLLAAAALPGEAKVHRSGARLVTKWPLRMAMKGRLPPRLANRPQRGLPQPLDQWLRVEGAQFLRERIESLCEHPDRLFDPAEVRRLMTMHLDGRAENGMHLWVLILFDAWRRSIGRRPS